MSARHAWTAAALALVLLAPALAVAAGYGGIEPGSTTQERVRELYGQPTTTSAKKIDGYDTSEWVYDGHRAPRGFIRMIVDFGLLAPDGFKPLVVRTLRLEPKPMIFPKPTVLDGWGVPEQMGQQGKQDVFLYEKGLVVTFDDAGVSATNMLFMVPQKLLPVSDEPRTGAGKKK
jgi:hypothetical protein